MAIEGVAPLFQTVHQLVLVSSCSGIIAVSRENRDYRTLHTYFMSFRVSVQWIDVASPLPRHLTSCLPILRQSCARMRGVLLYV